MKKRFNLLFVFSVSFFVCGTINWISKLFDPYNFLVDASFGWINILFENGILFSFVLIAIVYSLAKNYSKSKKLGLRLPYDSAMFLTGAELFVMLFGTLVSIMYYMFMSFSDVLFYQSLVFVMAIYAMYMNYCRPDMVEMIAKKLSKKSN